MHIPVPVNTLLFLCLSLKDKSWDGQIRHSPNAFNTRDLLGYNEWIFIKQAILLKIYWDIMNFLNRAILLKIYWDVMNFYKTSHFIKDLCRYNDFVYKMSHLLKIYWDIMNFYKTSHILKIYWDIMNFYKMSHLLKIYWNIMNFMKWGSYYYYLPHRVGLMKWRKDTVSVWNKDRNISD